MHRAKRVRHWENLSLRTVQKELTGAIVSAIDASLNPAPTSAVGSLFAPKVKKRKARIVVAFSGGRDSVALLEVLSQLAARRASPIESIWAVHVHHALSANANRWAKFCREKCKSLGIDCKVYHVIVKSKGEGVESAARRARYDALMKAAKGFGANMIMTAHHQDDRLETFLMQWMRGAGVDGLSSFGMDREQDQVHITRPWFNTPRAALERYLQLRELTWVDDESNDDTKYLRNAMRHNVLPAMDEAREGFRAAAARSVVLVSEASALLREYAQEDLQSVLDAPTHLSIAKLMQRSVPRQALILRAWIESFGLQAPSKSKLDEALRQTRQTHSDTKLTFSFTTHEIKRHGAYLVMREAAAQNRDYSRFETLAWHGQGDYPSPAWFGVVKFIRCEEGQEGFAQSLLESGVLQLRSRQGGEVIKQSRKRPRKHLKFWYQEAGIAEYERSALPLVWCNDELIWAAGIGADVRYTDCGDDEPRYRIEWVPDETLFSLMQE